MNKFLPIIFATGVFGLNAAASSESIEATYILKVASNLSCETLEISVSETTSGDSRQLVFGSGAFSATSLPAGTYAYGNVICNQGERGVEELSALKGQIAPFSVESGQIYFGGELILKADVGERAQTPEVLDNCIRGTGRSGGEYTGECQAGDGVSGEPKADRTVNFYAPQLSQDAVDRVRDALKTDQDLIYLPITPTGS